MDTRLMHTISKSEDLYNKRKTSKTIFLLIIRYIEASIVLPDKNIHLQKAMNIIVNAKPLTFEDITIKLLEAYIDIELGEYEEADIILKKLKSFKSWYKNKKPKEYAIMLMLLSQNEFEMNHQFRGKRYYKAFSEQLLYIKSNSIVKTLKDIYIEKYITNEPPILLDKTYYKNNISPLLYIQILFTYSYKKLDDCVIINRAIIWSIFHNIDDQKLIPIIQRYIDNYMQNNIANNTLITAEMIYKKFKTPEILNIICKLYITNTRIDKTALQIYIKSKENSDNIENFDYVYIMSAYKNDYYDIEPKIIQKLISRTELEQDLQAFVYHLILNNDNMKYMQPPNYYKILSFGKTAFEKKYKGIYYNSIYMFMFENDNKNISLQKYIFEQLFNYEIYILDDNIKYIWINEQYKEETQAYVVNDIPITVSASTPDFTIYCLGQKQRSFYNSNDNVIVKKAFLNTDKNIYTFFLNNSIVSLELILALAKYYIQQPILTYEAIYVLKLALEYNEISNYFKCKISSSLGKHFAKYKEYEISSGYFSILKPNQLTDDEINIAIISFTKTGNIAKAFKFYNSRKKSISDKAKINICTTAKEYNMFEKEISYISFELLLNGRNEKELLDNIFNYYKGTIQDWINAKKMLEALKIDTKVIKEKILEKALYNHKINDDIQDIFVELYINEHLTKNIKQFIEYIIYLVLTIKQNIKKTLLECLEKEYDNVNNEYLLYTIASVYIINNMEINRYRHNILKDAIDCMEKKNIMFPIFNEYKDKINEFPYLEKNVPFVYKALPNKNVYLDYKLKEEIIWHKKNMKYEKFGLYMTVLKLFYNETLEYYTEESDISNVNKIIEYINKNNTKIKEEPSDEYYNINNAVIYSQTLKYSEIENIISAQQNKKKYENSFGHLL